MLSPLRRAGLAGVVAIGLSLAGAGDASAQEPVLTALRQRVKSEELSLTVLLQSNGKYDPLVRSGSRSGFRVPNARVAPAGISRDSAAPIGGLVASITGKRRLLGGDLRAEWRGWLLAFESIGAWLDFTGGSRRTLHGWYLTGGKVFTPTLLMLARWERFEADGLGVDENLVLLGGQFRPTDAVRFRLHYGLPLSSDPLGRQRIVGGAQLAL